MKKSVVIYHANCADGVAAARSSLYAAIAVVGILSVITFLF